MRRSLTLLFAMLWGMSLPAAAAGIDPLLLRAQATIFPKIILLDKDLGEKTVASAVLVRIVHPAAERGEAMEMRRMIEAEYRNALGGNPLRVDTVSFDEFDEREAATAYILLSGPAAAQQKVTQHAAAQGRLVFSCDYKDMRHNALVSLLMKEKTYIYLNKNAMAGYGIRFQPLFYKIVKVLE